VNLARCPTPVPSLDDEAILACQRAFPLAGLVEALDARVVFLAKSGPVGRGVSIPGENTHTRLAIRYGSGSRGSRPGALHYSHWLPEVASRVRAFLDVE